MDASINHADMTNTASSSALPLQGLDMKKEADRLRTYERWPVSFMNKHDMAAAGFYFTGREDTVRCPVCGVRIGQWEPGDDPFKDHKRWSSSCGFIKGYSVGNIPIGHDDDPPVIAIKTITFVSLEELGED
jgi:hypothetical protein